MSSARLRIHPVARAEVRRAQRYYARQRVGLGGAVLHRFPYALVYEIRAPGSLRVLACFDMRQEDPPDWTHRR